MNKLILLCCFVPLLSFSQGEGKVWTEVGVKGEITKNLEWGAELNTRFGANGLETYFPQVTLKYKVTEWFRPSIDYRAIFDKEDNGNYSFSNRLNFNANFKHVVKRFTLSGRIRYQYAFNRISSVNTYDVEFDQAIRIKPEVSYDINNSVLSPVASVEFFYDPNFGPYGQRFSKYRIFAGLEFELDGPHDISIGYIFDQKIQVPNPRTRHVLNLSYTFNIGQNKKDKK